MNGLLEHVFPLIHGDAEAIAYPDASFDFAISQGSWGRSLSLLLRRWVPCFEKE